MVVCQGPISSISWFLDDKWKGGHDLNPDSQVAGCHWESSNYNNNQCYINQTSARLAWNVGLYSEDIVWELYTSYVATLRYKLDMRANWTRHAPLQYIRVCGKRVFFVVHSKISLLSGCWCNQDPPHHRVWLSMEVHQGRPVPVWAECERDHQPVHSTAPLHGRWGCWFSIRDQGENEER